MAKQTESSLTTVPSSYLNYLPACYAGADSTSGLPFLSLYLKAFEKLLSGIEDGADLETADKALDEVVAYRAGIRELLDATVIGNLFYPRWSFLFPDSSAKDFMPPLSGETNLTQKKAQFDMLAHYVGLPQYSADPKQNSPIERWARSFLEWLGGTIGLGVDKNWSIDSTRTIIAQTFAFDRARGTSMGMTWLLDACLAARPAPVQGVTVQSLSVVECTRAALIVFDDDLPSPKAFHVYDAYPDETNVVVISDVVGPPVTGSADGFSVDDSSLVAYVPWRFEINVTLAVGAHVAAADQALAIQAYFRDLQAVLDTAKPVLTSYAVNFTIPAPPPAHQSSAPFLKPLSEPIEDGNATQPDQNRMDPV